MHSNHRESHIHISQAATGAIQSSLHLDCHLSAPTFSMLSVFFPLSVICLAKLVWDEHKATILSRVQSTTSLSEMDTLSIPPPTSFERVNGTINSQNGASQQSFENRRPRIRAKPEKRNHLLTRWSICPPSPISVDRFYMSGNHDLDMNVEGATSNATTTSQAKQQQHTFLGWFPIKCLQRDYAIIAFFDVYANYTTILAYKYTTITSVALFDSLAIPLASFYRDFAS